MGYIGFPTLPIYVLFVADFVENPILLGAV